MLGKVSRFISENHDAEEQSLLEGSSSRGDANCGAKCFNFSRAVGQCLLGTVCFTIMIGLIVGVTIGIPSSMIAIGYLHKDDCPAQPYIPLYLMVAGTGALLAMLGSSCQSSNTTDQVVTIYPLITKSKCRKCLDCLLNWSLNVIYLFNISWAIAGSVWIFGAYKPNFEDLSAPDYCNHLLYNFAFWLLNSVYILIIIVILVVCFVACYSIFTSSSSAKTETDPMSRHFGPVYS